MNARPNNAHPVRGDAPDDKTASPCLKAGRADALAVAVLLLLSTGVLALGLDNINLWDPDQPRYAEITREMTEGGDYLLLHLYGEDYVKKPPLQFWLMATSSKFMGGVNEVSTRLPSALAGVGVVLLTFYLGRKMFGIRAGFLAGLALLASPYFVEHSRSARMDALLVLFVTAMIAVFYSAFEKGKAGPLTWPAFFLLGTLGVMTKGPVALALPLLVCAAFSLCRRDWRAWDRAFFIGAALCLSVIAAWLAAVWISAGYDFQYLRRLVIDQNLGRISGEVGGHVRRFYFFAGALPGVFSVWLPLIAVAMADAFRRLLRRDESGRRLLLPVAWFAAIFVFFSVIPSKHVPYLLPTFPAAAILTAWLLDSFLKGEPPRWAGIATGCLIAAILTVSAIVAVLAALVVWGGAGPLLVPGWEKFSAQDGLKAVMDGLRLNPAPSLVLGAGVVCLGVAGAWTAFRRKWRPAIGCMIAIFFCGVVFTFFVYNPLAYNTGNLRRFVESARREAGDSELAAMGGVVDGARFYARCSFRKLITPEDLREYFRGDGTKYCIVEAKELGEINAAFAGLTPPQVVSREGKGSHELVLLKSGG